MNKRRNSHWLRAGPTILLCLGFPWSAFCCEPILPMAQLLSGPSLTGAMLLKKSLVWLVVAVAIKCGAFALLERRLPWRMAILYMLTANLVSTVPGVLVAGCTASIGGIVIALPIVALLGWFVGNRPFTKRIGAGWSGMGSAGTCTLAFLVFFFVSVWIYALAQGALAQGALDDQSVRSYWLYKFLFVTLVASFGIVISAVLEEGVVARMSRKSLGNISFYGSVFRANYITLGLILLVAALEMLPKRLNAPGFLASWLHTLSSFLGLA